MPLIGDQGRFAVEYELDEDPLGEWMNGRVRCWCGGRAVVDWEDVSLRDVLFATEQILKHRGSRRDARFESLPAGEAYSLLRAGLFGRGQPPEDEGTIAAEGWARHIALPWFESAGFIVECTGYGRLFTLSDREGEVDEAALKVGELDAVLGQLRDALRGLLERSGPGGFLA